MRFNSGDQSAVPLGQESGPKKELVWVHDCVLSGTLVDVPSEPGLLTVEGDSE